MASFPTNFLWGSSTNAQQFEGGRNEVGVGISIADVRVIPGYEDADFSGFNGEQRVHDQNRMKFLRDHIQWMAKAVDDGVEMVGYCTWAAIDLYSTREDFGKRYGFVYIDADHEFKRIKKDSFHWYKKVIASNGADLADVEA